MGAALVAALAATAISAAPEPAWRLSPDGRRALDAVSADSLRGHLSFLAADALGGRVNGTPGIDIAAEYIAAQFRRAGLEPIGDDGYFQTAAGVTATPTTDGFRFSLALPDQTVEVRPETFDMTTAEPLSLDGVEVVKVPPGRADALEAVAGKVVITDRPEVPARAAASSAGLEAWRWIRDVLDRQPALVVVLARGMATPTSYFETPALLEPRSSFPPRPRVVMTSSPELARAWEGLPIGRPSGRLTLRLAEPTRREVRLRNVAGLLRGSDPAKGETAVVVSAHYDGTGPQPGASGPDRIWNGANDDGSGTVAVIELASTLSRLEPRPRRSIAFVAFFGEEKGLLGSAYYVAHPLLPLKTTVADVNLEHLGRTDSPERNKAGTASLTGYRYSDLSAVMEAAGRAMGTEVYEDERRSERFFEDSDNYSFAVAGVVAHTVAVLFDDFPDYHRPGDEWRKVDFANLERTVRMVGAAVLMLADGSEEPRWRPGVPSAEPYRAAWQARREAGGRQR